MKKTFAIWGTGDKSVFYTESLKVEERPSFYIDNNISKKGKTFYGKEIKHPSQVSNWKDIFVVIAIECYEEVKKQLLGYGLKQEEDFLYYMKVINSEMSLNKLVQELEESLDFVKNSQEQLKARALIFGAMISFDPNSAPNLNMLYEKFGLGSFTLVSETMKIKKMNEEGKIHYPYYLVPKMLLQNYYLQKTGIGEIPLDEKKVKYIEQREYLKIARTIMQGKNKDIEPNYDVEVTYYYDIYLRMILEILQPKCVVMWNEFYPFHLILDNICREKEIRRIYIEHGSLPGTYAIDEYGQMGESLVTIESKKFQELEVLEEEIKAAKVVWNYLYKSELNRNVQPDNKELDLVKEKLKPGKPIIFYAGQNDFESGLYPYTKRTEKYHSPVFQSSYEVVEFLGDIVEKKDWILIYKPHPLCIDKNITLPENVILIEHCDINKLIDISDVTITILSQVGYISTIRKKATIMLGYNQLKDKGCTYEAFSRDEIEKVIEKAIEQGFTRTQQKNFEKHIAQLLKYYLYDNEGEQKLHFGKKLSELWGEL